MNAPRALAASRGVGWYLKRLRVMRPAELVYRVGEQWSVRRLRASHGRFRPADAAALGFCNASMPQLPELPLDERSILVQQDSLLEGRWPALGYEWQWQQDAASWRRAPDSGREWPAGFFADIPHRAGNLLGDVRVAWEPARLQQLVSLAVIARRAEPAAAGRALRLIEDQLLSFTTANPPWAGIHYLSAMECALRLLAVVHAVDMVRDRLDRGSPAWTAVAALVSSHAPLIAARLSLHSSSGNHTIAESAGLVYAGQLFPELPQAARWRAQGLALLAQEMRRQVLPDGGGIEQAFWYLLMIADLAGLVVALLDARQESVPAALRDSLGQARQFLGALAREPAGLPPVGDRDDGFALSPALRLSFGAAPPAGRAHTFPQSGYTLARMDGAPHYEVLFDHGPLGMPPLFGHAHADALSVCLRVGGRDLLIDPGCFTYGGDLQWRAYFRSTAAHNTVSVDGRDQAAAETAFMWSRPYHAELVGTESGNGVFRALARHDGYRSPDGAGWHWRGLVLRTGLGLLVWDCVDGAGEHGVELSWHGRVNAVQSAGAWLLDKDTMLAVDSSGATTAIEASVTPPGGWWSPRYGIRQAGCTLRTAVSARLPVEFVTRIAPRGAEWPAQQLDEDLQCLRAWAHRR